MPDGAPRADTGTTVPLRDFHRRSSARAVATIAAEFVLIALAIAIGWAFDTIWAYPPLILLIGTRQYALGECMAHEASHRNLSRRPWLNEVLGIAVSWPFFFTLAGYRRFHNRLHHKTALTDDANSIYEDYEDWGLPPATSPLPPRSAVWHLIAKPLLGLIGIRHLLKTIEDFYWDRDLAENTAMLSFWALVVGLCAYAGWLGGLFLWWILPWLVVLPILNYWSEVGDHYRVAGAETRSNLSWPLNRLVSHNIGYHGLHHRDPAIPWFILPRAYGELRLELREQVSNGYREIFRQILAESQPTAKESRTRD